MPFPGWATHSVLPSWPGHPRDTSLLLPSSRRHIHSSDWCPWYLITSNKGSPVPRVTPALGAPAAVPDRQTHILLPICSEPALVLGAYFSVPEDQVYEMRCHKPHCFKTCNHKAKEVLYWYPSFPWTATETQKILKWLLILLLWCICKFSGTKPAWGVKCHRSI